MHNWKVGNWVPHWNFFRLLSRTVCLGNMYGMCRWQGRLTFNSNDLAYAWMFRTTSTFTDLELLLISCSAKNYDKFPSPLTMLSSYACMSNLRRANIRSGQSSSDLNHCMHSKTVCPRMHFLNGHVFIFRRNSYLGSCHAHYRLEWAKIFRNKRTWFRREHSWVWRGKTFYAHTLFDIWFHSIGLSNHQPDRHPCYYLMPKSLDQVGEYNVKGFERKNITFLSKKQSDL